MFPVIAKWTILEGNEPAALAALQELATAVEQGEPFTWMYTIHTPNLDEQNLPTPPENEVVFFSVFADADAFQKHLTGPIFQAWAAKYLNLFLTNWDHLFVLAEYLNRQAGFVREEMVSIVPSPAEHVEPDPRRAEGRRSSLECA
jgi:quinol monooxygenase YgiN